jgi:hypothetical protein
VKGNIAAAQVGAVRFFEENLVGATVDDGNVHFPAHFLSFCLTARGDLSCQIQRENRRFVDAKASGRGRLRVPLPS